MKIAVLVGGIAYETQRRLLEGIMKYFCTRYHTE